MPLTPYTGVKYPIMETLSTVLFINHVPLGYRVQKTPDRMELHPAENHMRSEVPPRLAAAKKDGAWQVLGTQNKDLIRQVLDEIQLLEQRTPDLALSAAP